MAGKLDYCNALTVHLSTDSLVYHADKTKNNGKIKKKKRKMMIFY